MTELHHSTLRDAISRLPEYNPPNAVWDELEEALEAEAQVQETVPNLPVYDPPKEVWSHIEASLNQQAKPPRVIQFGWVRRLAAAAVLTGVLLGAWLLTRQTGTPTEALTVSQETIDHTVSDALKEPEDAAFDLVQNLCAGAAPVCNQPAFKTLKSELDELTLAKNELKQAMGAYADDPDLTAQLVRIERARSELLQQMMQMI
jgi:hypothetical protein